MPLDLATSTLLQQLAAAGAPPMHLLDPVTARQAGAMMAQMIGPGPEMTQVQEPSLISADGGQFRMRVLCPDDQPRAVIVYFHGGGWVVGDIDATDTLGR